MEEKKGAMPVFFKKSKQPPTNEEIAVAFDSSFAICFSFAKDAVKQKNKLLETIWRDINPDMIATKADLVVMSTTLTVLRDQQLLINRNGSKESADEIVKLLTENGALTEAYCFFSEKKNGIRDCYRYVVDNDELTSIKEADLLTDGDKPLLTVKTYLKHSPKNESDTIAQSIKRGDIFYADLSPVVGNEEGGIRPVLIISNDELNQHLPTVTTAAITSRVENTETIPTHVNLDGGLFDRIIMLEQMRTLDKRRLLQRVEHLNDELMQKVDAAILIGFGIEYKN